MLGFSCFSFFCETKESKKQNITYCLPLLTRLPERLRHHLSQIALLKSKSGQTDFPSNNSRPFSLCKVAQFFVLTHHNSFMRITMPCPVSCLSVVYLAPIKFKGRSVISSWQHTIQRIATTSKSYGQCYATFERLVPASSWGCVWPLSPHKNL